MCSDPRPPLADAIYQNMRLKETRELLSIWVRNDRSAWTDETFEIIQDLLIERLGSVPPQGKVRGRRKPKKKPKSLALLPIKKPASLSLLNLAIILALLAPILWMMLKSVLNDRWIIGLLWFLLDIFLLLYGINLFWLVWFHTEKFEKNVEILVSWYAERSALEIFFFRLGTFFMPDHAQPALHVILAMAGSVIAILIGSVVIIELFKYAFQ